MTNMKFKNYCTVIDDFYECLINSDKYENVVLRKTVGPFGGTKSSYTIPTNGGFVKVTCNFGIDTFRIFNNLEILLVGSVKGNIGDGWGKISSEGSKISALEISTINATGKFHAKGLFANNEIQLPIPMIK